MKQSLAGFLAERSYIWFTLRNY